MESSASPIRDAAAARLHSEFDFRHVVQKERSEAPAACLANAGARDPSQRAPQDLMRKSAAHDDARRQGGEALDPVDFRGAKAFDRRSGGIDLLALPSAQICR